jgi:iron(III) transport system permease protein
MTDVPMQSRLGVFAAGQLARIDLWQAGLVSIAIIVCLLVGGLVVGVVWLSFVDGLPGDPDLTYTLAHYRSILLDGYTYQVISNTIGFSAISLVVSLALGLPIAWLIERTDFPGKPIVFTMMTIGILIPGFSVALGWIFLLHPRIGIVNQLLMSVFSLAEAPFDPATILGMGLIEGLSLSPVVFIMTAVVFRAMDPSLEEAALMNGATQSETLRRVTLPLAWPGIVAASIYVFIIGFAAFDIPAVIGLSRRIFTFSTYVFHQVSPNEGVPKYGDVATLSVIMIVLAAVLSWGYSVVQTQAPRYAVVTGKAYRPRVIALATAKPIAVALVSLYFVVTQLMPVLMLIWASGLPYLQPPSAAALAAFSLKNYVDLPGDVIWAGVKNTAILMVAVPTITVGASIAISWVVLRSKIPLRGLIDFFAFLPHAVPTIVFSIAAWLIALFIFNRFVPIYGTIWILVLVYCVVRLSYGSRTTNSALIQIHRELDESALMSGADTSGVIRSVLIPLLAPTILYAWIWIALLAYRELTLPVILSSASNQPLSVVVWSLVAGSSYGMASAVATIMLAIMLPILVVYWIVARRTGLVAQS